MASFVVLSVVAGGGEEAAGRSCEWHVVTGSMSIPAPPSSLLSEENPGDYPRESHSQSYKRGRRLWRAESFGVQHIHHHGKASACCSRLCRTSMKLGSHAQGAGPCPAAHSPCSWKRT